MCLDLLSSIPPQKSEIYRPLLSDDGAGVGAFSSKILSGGLDPKPPLTPLTRSTRSQSYPPSSLLDPKVFTLIAVSFAFLYFSNIIVLSSDL